MTSSHFSSVSTLVNGHVNGNAANIKIAPSSTLWVVQKFGGTSVGKFPLDIVEGIIRSVGSGGVKSLVLTVTIQTKSSRK